MSTKKQIPDAEWQERLQTFSTGNSGRTTAIAAQGMTIVERKPFRDIEYDPVGKGNDMVITLGEGNDVFRHIVAAPVELYLHQESDGVVSTLEIVDQNGEITFVRLLN